MIYNNTILNCVETACYNVLQASASLYPSASIYRGVTNEEKAAPCVIVYANHASDEMPRLGVWHVNVNVIVKSMAADSTITGSDAFTDKVFALLLDDSTRLGDWAGNLYVYDKWVESIDSNFDGDAWVSTLSAMVVAVNSD